MFLTEIINNGFWQPTVTPLQRAVGMHDWKLINFILTSFGIFSLECYWQCVIWLQVDLNIPNIQTPDGIAYDWIYKNLYWTDTTANTINLAAVDHKNEVKPHRVLYSNSDDDCKLSNGEIQGNKVCIDEPRALVVHPKKVGI